MSKNKKCPKCGASASGNFCGECGSAVKARHCTQCGATLTAGARFCTQCGTTSSPAKGPSGGASRASGGGGGIDPQVGWWVAGGMMIVLILVFAWPILSPEDVAPVPLAPAPTGAAAIDLNSMTPRQAADRLYDRVMSAAENGDSAQARQFIPMAIQAYQGAVPLDADGLFHLSTLHRTSGDLTSAEATAQEGLAADPDHLLLLYAAAEVARELGDLEAARGYYQAVLDNYDAEMASGLLEYELHGNQMPTIRSDAESYLAGGG